MSFNLTNITGSAQTGFTSPVFTVTSDIAPAINGKQWTVSAVSGAGVPTDVNSVSDPFTISAFRPALLKAVPQANPQTGVVRNVPINQYKVITRKGAQPNANSSPLVCRVTTVIEVFAGCDTYQASDVRAMLSAHIGALSQQSAGLGDTVTTGTL